MSHSDAKTVAEHIKGLNSIHEIERAIDALTPQQMNELHRWIEENHPNLIDAEANAKG